MKLGGGCSNTWKKNSKKSDDDVGVLFSNSLMSFVLPSFKAGFYLGLGVGLGLRLGLGVVLGLGFGSGLALGLGESWVLYISTQIYSN